MVASRRASMVFPAPGGPSISTLWAPAAAISSARLAWACPRTSAKSAAAPAGSGVESGSRTKGRSGRSPLRYSIAS